jgi:hypothetical protein
MTLQYRALALLQVWRRQHNISHLSKIQSALFVVQYESMSFIPTNF